MALDYLAAVEPPLHPETMRLLEATLPKNHAGLSVIATLGDDGLKEVTGIESVIERARILSAIGTGDDPKRCFAPPPRGPNGEPVIVYPKIGFTNLSQVDTVNQTCHVRFYLDLYWHDPRMVGMSKVPEGIWRPADCYIINQHGEMTRILHDDRPTLIDSSVGLLLWPVELVGEIQNPMKLHAFPFDADAIEIHIHQNERSSRDEYLLRPYKKDEDEKCAVRFFFGVFDDLTEFDVVGFSRDCYEDIGGNQIEYSNCKLVLHVVRRWQFYLWKVSSTPRKCDAPSDALAATAMPDVDRTGAMLPRRQVAMPVMMCTVFSFSALFFPITGDRAPDDTKGLFNNALDAEALSERNNVAATMLLASSALLYVVASTLPKTSYLTTMDKFVLLNLLIQFEVAQVSWLTCGVFFPVETKAANDINLVAFILLFAVLLVGSYWILGRPIARSFYDKPREWPQTLSREDPSTRYFAFETFVNVFPPWDPGSPNPVKIPEKKYGAAGATDGVEIDVKKMEPQRLSFLGQRKSRVASTGQEDRPSSGLLSSPI